MGRIANQIIEWISLLWGALVTLLETIDELLGSTEWDRDVHTTITYRAIVDAVVPETPMLADELGPDHVSGGIATGLDEFLITYIDNAFQFGLPHVGPRGNIPFAEPVAKLLDAAALVLLERGENASEPQPDRALSLLSSEEKASEHVRARVGPFASLSRRDRLRAINLLDEVESEITPTDFDLIEIDGGLVGQLVVGFGEMIYYSEWQGYADYMVPPSERVHTGSGEAIQSWRQTGYPGRANGYAALRGYLGTDDGTLGDGEAWTTIDEATSSVRISRQSGSFRENAYDTNGYEEPYPE